MLIHPVKVLLTQQQLGVICQGDLGPTSRNLLVSQAQYQHPCRKIPNSTQAVQGCTRSQKIQTQLGGSSVCFIMLAVTVIMIFVLVGKKSMVERQKGKLMLMMKLKWWLQWWWRQTELTIVVLADVKGGLGLGLGLGNSGTNFLNKTTYRFTTISTNQIARCKEFVHTWKLAQKILIPHAESSVGLEKTKF